MKRFLLVLTTTLAPVVYGNEDIHTINLVKVENPSELRVAISTILFNEIYSSALITNDHLRRFHEVTRDWGRARRLDWFADLPDPYSINDLIEFLRPHVQVPENLEEPARERAGIIPPVNSLEDIQIPQVPSGSASPASPASPEQQLLISRPTMYHGPSRSFVLRWEGKGSGAAAF